MAFIRFDRLGDTIAPPPLDIDSLTWCNSEQREAIAQLVTDYAAQYITRDVEVDVDVLNDGAVFVGLGGSQGRGRCYQHYPVSSLRLHRLQPDPGPDAA